MDETKKAWAMWTAIALALAAVADRSDGARAETVGASYFAGKTMTVWVGFAPGGAAATEAMVVARHLSKHVPGNPTVIVGHRPGAGGRVLNNYLYGVAPPNGLEIGRVDNGVVVANLLDDPSVKFEADKFGWIGSFASDGWAFFLRRETGIGSLEELKASKTPPKIGSISAVHKTYTNARLLEVVSGVKLDMVTGYPSGREVELAITRKELDGSVAAYSGFMQRSLAQYKAGEIAVLMQSGLGTKHVPAPGLENVPVVWAIAPPESQALLRAANLPWNSPFVAPPKTPTEVVGVLRASLKSLSQDAEFQAEYAKVVGSEVDYTPGEQLEDDANAIRKSPPDVVKMLKALFGNS
jgi:tripartite-type tricarboxylate transporter receptor subunit TctC